MTSAGLLPIVVVLFAVLPPPFLARCHTVIADTARRLGVNGRFGQENAVGLDAEAAREALLRMVERRNDRTLSILAERLRTAHVERAGLGAVRIGRWRIDLAEKKFSVVLSSAHLMVSYAGVFRQNGNAQWTAEITTQEHAQLAK